MASSTHESRTEREREQVRNTWLGDTLGAWRLRRKAYHGMSRSTLKRNVAGGLSRRIAADAAGQAMLIVLALVAVLALLPVMLAANSSQHVPITLQVQNSKAALAAAESGATEYMTNLQQNPSFVEYNDVNCNVPTGDTPLDSAFFLPTNYCNGPGNPVSLSTLTSLVDNNVSPSVPSPSSISRWAPISGSSPYLAEQFAYTVDGGSDVVNNSGTLNLIVVGRAGIGPTVQYRTVSVEIRNPALSYAYFTNYQTASPYLYSTSIWFQYLMDLVNFAISSDPSLKSMLGTALNNGPAGDIALGALFCNYHAYDTNAISMILHQYVPSLMTSYLSGLASFNPLGIPIGSDIATSIENEVKSIIGYIPLHGPFPLLCNVNDLYGGSNGNGTGGGYYGLHTQISGNVYSIDSLYTCGSPNLSNAQVTFGNGNSNPMPAASGTFLENNLFQWSLGPYNLGPFGTYGPYTLLQGCTADTAGKPKSVTVKSSVRTPPEPNFGQIRALAGTSGKGCTYVGPTFFNLLPGGGMQVYSPDTTTPAPGGCLPSQGSTISFPSGGMVVYVRNLPSSQSCASFPDSAGGGAGFVLPFGQTTPIQHHNCHWGDALVQGTLKGQLTIAASNDVVITGNVVYACATNNGQVIPPNCPDSLGLAPGGNVPINEPYTASKSGSYYPQGNVTIVHPVVNGQNDNNCSEYPQLGGNQVNGCPNSTSGPHIVPPLPSSVSPNCGPGFWPWTNTSIGACIYGILNAVYKVEYNGYYCGLDTELLTIFGQTCSASTPNASSLVMNQANTNTNPGKTAVPSTPSPPTCTPNYNFAWSYPIPAGPCTKQWVYYYLSYGMEGLGWVQQFCSYFGISCSAGGFESSLQTWEGTWTHGPVNSFPAIYNPTVDAVILASNSLPQIQSIDTASPRVIQNGSFTLQNPQSGNQYGTGHGLGTLTARGSVVVQYNDGFSSAGLLYSHFEGLNSNPPGGCRIICYVSSGYRNVSIGYDAHVLYTPPPYLIKNSSMSSWTVHQFSELPAGNVIGSL